MNKEQKTSTVLKDKKKKQVQSKEQEKIEITHDEILAMNQKIADAEDKFLRTQAELVNYRKRKDEEVERKLKYANENLILELLPILDNFERGINMDDSNLNDDISKFLSGMKMIYSSLVNTLEKFEVKEIKALGETFDEFYHNAVMVGEEDSKEKGIILEVYQKGYTLKDKVIRPAMVKVNK